MSRGNSPSIVPNLWLRFRCGLRTVPFAVAMAIASVCALAVYTQSSGESCRSNLKQYALGIMMYVQDYDEFFPPMKTPAMVTKRVLPYVKNTAIFSCPDSGAEFLPNPALNYVNVATVKSPSTMMMLRDAKPHTESDKSVWNVAYADGHVKQVSTEPILGKPAPAPKPLTKAQQIRGELAQLRRSRQQIDAQIRKLEAQQSKLRGSRR